MSEKCGAERNLSAKQFGELFSLDLVEGSSFIEPFKPCPKAFGGSAWVGLQDPENEAADQARDLPPSGRVRSIHEGPCTGGKQVEQAGKRSGIKIEE